MNYSNGTPNDLIASFVGSKYHFLSNQKPASVHVDITTGKKYVNNSQKNVKMTV